MLPRRFAELPVEMQNESVSPYFELLSAKRSFFAVQPSCRLLFFCWRFCCR